MSLSRPTYYARPSVLRSRIAQHSSRTIIAQRAPGLPSRLAMPRQPFSSSFSLPSLSHANYRRFVRPVFLLRFLLSGSGYVLRGEDGAHGEGLAVKSFSQSVKKACERQKCCVEAGLHIGLVFLYLIHPCPHAHSHPQNTWPMAPMQRMHEEVALARKRTDTPCLSLSLTRSLTLSLSRVPTSSACAQLGR